MSKIMEIISTRLNNKELLSCEINRLIRDVFNIIGKDRSYESSRLKQALRILGWEEHILDYRTLELICLHLEAGSKDPTRCRYV